MLLLVEPVNAALLDPHASRVCTPPVEIFCEEIADEQRPDPLPDLITLPPFNLRLYGQRQNGTLTLRFSNSIANIGEANLDLHGVYDPAHSQIQVTQQLRTTENRPNQHQVGAFFFHAEHNHWHWPGFSLYEVWSAAPSGRLVEQVAVSDKVSYCLLDSDKAEYNWFRQVGPPGRVVSRTEQYRYCEWRRQGISVGWIDTYDWDIPGQVINLSHLPDGRYALRSVVNPDGFLKESDRSNNAGVVYFSLQGNTLSLN